METQNKNILVTGVANGGIGEVIVKKYSENNNMIICSKNMTNDRINGVLAFTADCTDEKDILKLEKYIVEHLGSIDIMINCIGGSLGSYDFLDIKKSFFDQVIAVNLTSAFLLSQMAVKLMSNNKEGRIVHIVSSAAYEPETTKLPYGIAKIGLDYLIKSMAKILAPKNIFVNGVSPTYVYTQRHIDEITQKAEKLQKTREELMTKYVAKQLIPNYLYPEDLLPFIELAIKTRHMTGKVLHATAGRIL